MDKINQSAVLARECFAVRRARIVVELDQIEGNDGDVAVDEAAIAKVHNRRVVKRRRRGAEPRVMAPLWQRRGRRAVIGTGAGATVASGVCIGFGVGVMIVVDITAAEHSCQFAVALLRGRGVAFGLFRGGN